MNASTVTARVEATSGSSPLEAVQVDFGDGSTVTVGPGITNTAHTYQHLMRPVTVFVVCRDATGNISLGTPIGVTLPIDAGSKPPASAAACRGGKSAQTSGKLKYWTDIGTNRLGGLPRPSTLIRDVRGASALSGVVSDAHLARLVRVDFKANVVVGLFNHTLSTNFVYPLGVGRNRLKLVVDVRSYVPEGAGVPGLNYSLLLIPRSSLPCRLPRSVQVRISQN